MTLVFYNIYIKTLGVANNGTHLFVTGGGSGLPDRIVNYLQIYDIVHDIWFIGSPMKNERRFHACSFNEKANAIFVFGGEGDFFNVTNTIEKYDISSNTWIKLNPDDVSLSDPKTYPFSTTFNSRYIFIYGGWDYRIYNDLADIEIFDAINEKMVQLSDINAVYDDFSLPETDSGVTVVSTELIDGNDGVITLYLIGGYDDPDAIFWSEFVYHLIEIDWESSGQSAAPDLTTQYTPALGIYNNTLFFIGTVNNYNQTDSESTIATIEIDLNRLDTEDENANWSWTKDVNMWNSTFKNGYNWHNNSNDSTYLNCLQCSVNVGNYLFIVAPDHNGVKSTSIVGNGIMFIFNMKLKMVVSMDEYSYQLPESNVINCCYVYVIIMFASQFVNCMNTQHKYFYYTSQQKMSYRCHIE